MSLTLFSGPFGGSDSQTGGDRWRVTMRSLWDYLRRDMRDAEVQQKKLYPRNWKKHVLRTVPFVWALARELATAYVQEPGRRWTDLDGNPLPGATQRLIAAEYKRARVNRIMRHAHRQLIALNSATIWSWPDPASSGVSLQLIPPHEQEVQMATPFGLSEDSVEFWRFRVPLPMPPDPQMFTWAVAEVSPTRATWTQAPVPLQGRGLYETSGANPWGMVPVAMLRGSEPGPGEFWPPAPEDVLHAQRAMNHDYTDVGTVARHQAFGQPVLKSDNPKDKALKLGPETAIVVGTTGDFSFAQADPKLDGYVLQNEKYATGVIGMNGLSPATFTKSTGITAVAKQMELIDRESYRKEHMEILRAAEQRLYDVMRAQINWMRGGVEVWPAALVEVEYREPVLPVDPLHDAQALKMMIEMHQTSESRARALRDGTSVEEAKRRIEEERKEEDARGGVTPAPIGGETTETKPPEDGEATDTPVPEGGDEQPADAGPVIVKPAGADVQKEALNGAQSQAMDAILDAVAEGRKPEETARAQLLATFPLLDEATVDRMLIPYRTFTPRAAPPSPTPAPFPPKPEATA